MESNLIYDKLHTADGYIEVATYNGVISMGLYDHAHGPTSLRLTIEQAQIVREYIRGAEDRATRDQG